jgi:hypothetical protein
VTFSSPSRRGADRSSATTERAAQFLAIVRKLADDIEKGWNRAGRATEAFQGVAREALEALGRPPRIGLEEVLSTLARCEVLPTQAAAASGTWGDPPVTVYNGEDFLIDVYFFVEPTLSIHSHSFTGAFTPLVGRCAHTTFRLEEASREGTGFLFGALSPLRPEILSPGDVRGIPLGLDLIHNVAHLSEPTVSLVTRTAADRSDVGLYAFFLPGLGMRSSDYLDEGAGKKVGLIKLMHRIRDPRMAERVGVMLDHAEDLHAAWFAYAFFDLQRDVGLLEEMLGSRTRRRRRWVAPLLAAARRGAMTPVHGFGGLDERERLRLVMDTLLGDPAETRRALGLYDGCDVSPPVPGREEG